MIRRKVVQQTRDLGEVPAGEIERGFAAANGIKNERLLCGMTERDDGKFSEWGGGSHPTDEIKDVTARIETDQHSLRNSGVEEGVRDLLQVVPGMG